VGHFESRIQVLARPNSGVLNKTAALSLPLEQIATAQPRDCASCQQIHKTVENIDLRCSHGAFMHVCAVVVECRIVFLEPFTTAISFGEILSRKRGMLGV
jgi:hypothetical protein